MMVNNREKALENGTKGASMAYIDSPRGAHWQEYHVGKIGAESAGQGLEIQEVRLEKQVGFLLETCYRSSP